MLKAYKHFEGLLLGAAVGDSLGLPREGIKPKRALKRFGAAPLEHGLIILPNKKHIGLCSDDTEHTYITAQAIISSKKGDEKTFAKHLSRGLKRWFLTLPSGLGMATLKACVKLMLGYPFAKSGVNSAGNGAAMRAPIIGAFFAHDDELMTKMLKASTDITHRNEEAFEGAWIIAKAIAMQINQTYDAAPVDEFFETVVYDLKSSKLRENIFLAREVLNKEGSLADLVAVMGLEKKGVTGYIAHTVPAVIFTWLKDYGNFEQAITHVIQAGGDTDSTAALVGALIGVKEGAKGIPAQWLVGVKEWPADIAFLKRVAKELSKVQVEQKIVRATSALEPAKAPRLSYFKLLLRNIVFFFIVMLHGIRRLIPF